MSAAEKFGAAFPDWLPQPSCPAIVLCGPPCAGKSTAAATIAAPGDIIIDLDGIAAELFATPLHAALSEPQIAAALRERNARLAQLDLVTQATAILIVSAGHPAKRRWWALKMGGARVQLVDPGRDVCLDRAASRPDPERTRAAIEGWYDEARGAQRWMPPAMHAEERGGTQYNEKWRKARRTFLSKPERRWCAMCVADGRAQPSAASVVDHVRPHRGDSKLFWDKANWQPLCASHHSSAKQRLERGRGGGVDADGRPTDPNHPAYNLRGQP
ncbi:MAG: AAA family ATPase [Sphingomonadaceae bacterium]|nr:AAA family ATPase [Sphingomonadaceae bacterium]